ncbi:molybdopterin molybdotransferase MoeA [Collinsella ihumii]|uniref:Molybdopterin molybdenumtransferase n=1 Tax=Collinsella ihumii TaxID=1720204 RepID=A0AAW7JSP8_9ACTN|nr:gephyrin-like molybdotransferase Glp [Collinsella ihumii]MDN0069422.1 molybdopterin molybdotransferase MoeA [Collinsella ihumii]
MADENMIALEQAQAIVLDHVEPTESIRLPCWRAVGFPLAADVATDIDLSPFANSAMDGYAVRAADLAGASPEAPVVLDVIGHEAAGHVFEGTIGAGQTVRIMTGAPMADGADAVVKYEIVEVLDGDGNEGSRVRFAAPIAEGENVRAAGLEAHAQEVVMRAGETVTAAGAGLLASAGAAEVEIHRRPVLGIISIGSELVAPDRVPARGQIRDANSSALMASALQAGADARFYGIATDDEDEISAKIHQAMAECDFVITSGGASAGDYDYVTALVRREGEVLFDRISLRPGKAITFGLIGGVPYLGLSGNPAAAAVGFEMLARPAIRKMLGFRDLVRPVQSARVTHDVKKGQQRRFYDRARVERDDVTGELLVSEASSQNSALLGTLHHANCLLMVPEGLKGYQAGDEVRCVRIDIEEGTVL